MSRAFNAVYVVAVVTVLAVNVESVSFDFSCQVPSLWLRVLHQVHVGPENSQFVSEVLAAGAVSQADSWIREEYQNGVTSSVHYFTEKQHITRDVVDTCVTVHEPFREEPIQSAFDNLPINVGSWTGSASVSDALIKAATMDWDSPSNAGRRVVFVYSGSLPSEAPTSGMDAFNPLSNCEDVSAASVTDVNIHLNDLPVYVIFVVPNHLVNHYKAYYATDLVIPQVDDPTLMAEYMLRGLDSMYCLVDTPTIMPTTSSSRVMTTVGDCLTDAALEMVVVQDISYSYKNDLPNLRNKFPSLIPLIGSGFASSRFGLTSFSDKPFFPFGYSGDHCYAEEQILTTSSAEFQTALANLRILSGRDWRDSHYDAMRETMLSDTIGWTKGDTVDGKKVLRVLLMATDALPHLPKDSALPVGTDSDSCAVKNFPSAEMVGELLNSTKSYSIIISTNDIYRWWRRQANDFGLDFPPQVLRLDDDAAAIFASLTTALEHTCEYHTRRLEQLEADGLVEHE